MLDLFDLAPKDRLVAQLLLSQGVIKMDDFRKALERSQESFFFSLAEIIVGQGIVTLRHTGRNQHGTIVAVATRVALMWRMPESASEPAEGGAS